VVSGETRLKAQAQLQEEGRPAGDGFAHSS
jgi:hypothetical protein